ncbi:MAG TPA: glycosyl hydrolase family 18 protein [Bacteroidota bacterium]|nr:glycosyl hydrolase family 18 protein [Bacteroidota bacterium]
MKKKWKLLFRYVRLYILGVSIFSSSVFSQYRIVGYYASWSQSVLPVSSIQFSSLTHINYAFATPNADGSISSTNDTNLISAAHRAGCKILISLGGASSGSVFSSMTSDTTKRMVFVSNLVTMMNKYHYDGADFDWESPSSTADSTNELLLMKQVYQAFQKSDTSLLITMAIGSSPYTGQWRNYSELNPYVNWYNVMTYDLDQGWSGKSGYNAALYYYTAMGNDYSVDQSITYLTVTRQIPPSKLTLGVPFYGKMFSNCTSFNTTFTSPETTPFYYDIVNNYSTWTRFWDNVAKVPYLCNGVSLISYDDSLSVALKCEYAKTKKLSGMMIWEISQDVIGSNQPLLQAIAKEMTTSTGIAAQSYETPLHYSLQNNYPNPFNPTTNIQFTLPRAGYVTLKVYDVLGREIVTLINGWREAGTNVVTFNASSSSIASGIYFYRLASGNFTQTKRCLVLK